MKRFIHLTDLHFSHKDKTQNEIYFETRQTILDVLIKIKKLKPEPEFILISGDLTNTGDVKSYQALQDILNQISIPIYIALGNHDKRSSFNKVFKKINSKKPLFYSQILKGLNLIGLKRKGLNNNKIQTINYFAGNILLHSGYEYLDDAKKYPNANQVLGKVFFLGCSPTINDKMIQYIADIIEKYNQKKEKNYD